MMSGIKLSLLIIFFVGCSIPKLKERRVPEQRRFEEAPKPLTITDDSFEDPWIRRRVEGGQKMVLGDNQTRYRVHLALFETYFPRELLKRSASDDDYYRLVQGKLWRRIHRSPLHLSILDILSNMRILSSNLLLELYRSHPRLARGVNPFENLGFFESKIAGFSDKKIQASFANLRLMYRDKFLVMLLSSRHPIYRSLASNIRNFYIDFIFNLTEVRQKLGLGKTYIQKFDADLPEFEVTNLFYDRPTGKVRGGVDHIIVGAPISSFYLAYELVKKGKHVVLLGEDEIDFRAWQTIDGPSGVGIQLRRPEGIYRPLGADLDHPEIIKIIQQWEFHGNKTLPPLKAVSSYVNDALSFLELSPYQEEKYRKLAIPFLRSEFEEDDVKPGHYSWKTLRDDDEGVDQEIAAKRIFSKFKYLKGKFTYIPRSEIKRIIFEGDRSYKKVIGVEFYLRRIVKKRRNIRDIYKVSLPARKRLKLFGRNVTLNLRADHTVNFFKHTGFQNPNIGKNMQLFPHINLYGVFSVPMKRTFNPEVFSYVRGKPRYPGDILPDPIFYSHYRSFDLGEFVLQEVQPLPKHRMKKWRHYYPLRVGILPQIQNRIQLTQKNNLDFYDFDLSETEKARLRYGIIEAGKILLKMGANSLLLPSLETKKNGTKYLYDKIENLEDLKNAVKELSFQSFQTQLFSHVLTGGMPLGPEEKKHVVGENYEVFGVRDLYLIGDSVLPSALPFGVELANMIMAKRLSEQF